MTGIHSGSMEDLSTEWKIQEYSSKEKNGKGMSWILNKGLGLGKKILVTGIVISSVPLVLPPLLVVSAIGFVLSVPYGFFLASHACTNMLMSKLLPMPIPPLLLLEYGKVSHDEEKVSSVYDENGGKDVGFRGNIDVEEEEAEKMEDTRGVVEMRIELVEKGNEELDEGVEKGKKEIVDVNEIVEENGYKEEIGENLDEEKKLSKEIEVKVDEIREEEDEEQPVADEQPMDMERSVVVAIEGDEQNGSNVEVEETPFEVKSVVIKSKGNEYSDIEEEEVLVLETRGLKNESIRNEGKADKAVEEDKHCVEKIQGGPQEANQRAARTLEENGIPFEEGNVNGNVELEKPIKENEGKLEEVNRKEIPKEREGMQYVDDDDTITKEVKPIEPNEFLLEGRDGNNSLETEKSVRETGETVNGGSIITEEQVFSVATLQGGKAEDNNANGIKQDFQLKREKETVISSNADAREIANESGFEVFDDKNAAGQKYSNAEYDTQGVHKSQQDGNSYGGDIDMASNKVLYSEEKIWEKIDAIRTIVGYKATLHASYIEELKALYFFTGVEPPASFKDPSDLEEVNNKLRLLMSVVGVQ